MKNYMIKILKKEDIEQERKERKVEREKRENIEM